MASYEDYQNNKLFRLGGKLADLMILSGLWLLCCLPVVTIGASTAALYYSVNKRFNLKSEDNPSSLFFHSFKDNIKQGTLLTLIYIVFIGFIVFDITAANKGIGGFTLPEAYKMFAYVLILPVVFTVFYIFPFISRYSNTIGKCLFNSFLLSASHIDHTIYLVLMNVVTVLACVFFPPAVLVLPALCALLSAIFIEKDFARAAQQAEEAAKAAAESDGEDDCEDHGEDSDSDDSACGDEDASDSAQDDFIE